jgi:polysaccharide export outer membrane protein
MKKNPIRMQRNLVGAVIVFFVSAGAVFGGTGPQGRDDRSRKNAVPAVDERMSKGSSETGRGGLVFLVDESEYRVGPKDLIQVQVENFAELSQTVRVNADGTIRLPYLGRIAAEGKTTEELADSIAAGLRGDYLKEPKVTVTVKEYRSRVLHIEGAVRNPGAYVIEDRPSMLKLITLAGGLTNDHGSTAFVFREIKKPDITGGAGQKTSQQGLEVDDAKYQMIKVNINGLLKGHFEQNLVLEPGDIVNIPTTDVFFIAGEVNAPGSYPLKQGTSLRQAISLAQGTNYKAALSRAVIFREAPDTGKREELKVDIKAVMSGKQEDIPLQANDVIIIPGSGMKSFGGTLLRAFGFAVVTTVPYRY